MKRFLLCLLVPFFIQNCTQKEASSTNNSDKSELENKTLMNGDIIFQTSTSRQSKAIQLATHSTYSHLGIIYQKEDEYWVYEAVEPVKLTKLNDWIKRGKNGHYVVKRLKNAATLLTKEVLNNMKSYGEQFKGKHYDLYFEWSDDKIYCSELVWKIYKKVLDIELGTLSKLKDFDLSNALVQQKIQERFKDNIPLEELVISPAAMFESEHLVTVINKK